MLVPMAPVRGARAITAEQAGTGCAILAIVFFVLGGAAHFLRPVAERRGVHLEALTSLAVCVLASLALVVRYHRSTPAAAALGLVEGQIFIIWSCFVLGWRIDTDELFGEFLLIWFCWWLAMAITCGSMMAGSMLWRRWRASRIDPTRCPGCGYSLIGLPSQRCPECGRGFTLDELGVTARDLTILR
jgi:hypothetical protein